MSDKYVNPDTGDDANAGTSGAPYLTIDKAIKNITQDETIWLANTVAFKYGTGENQGATATAFTAANHGSEVSGANPTAELPNTVRVWDIGSLYIETPNGNIPAAHIDSNDAVGYPFTGIMSYFIFQGLKFFGSTSYAMLAGSYKNFYECEFTDWSVSAGVGGTSASSYSTFMGCWFHDGNIGDTKSTIGLAPSVANFVYGNTFSGIQNGDADSSGIKTSSVNTTCMKNIFVDNQMGITEGSYDTNIINNTFVGDTVSDASGIYYRLAVGDNNKVVNNVFADMPTGEMIYTTQTPSELTVGANRLADVGDYWNTTVPTLEEDLTHLDVDDNVDPFNDAAGGDYSLTFADPASSGMRYPSAGFLGDSTTIDHNSIGAASTPLQIFIPETSHTFVT